MDEVQLADRAYQHRNIFLTTGGSEKYLTVNISKKGYRGKYIKELELSNPDWQKEHFYFIQDNYKKHPFFDEVIEVIQEVYEKDYKFLIDPLYDSMRIALKMFGIRTPVRLMSELDYDRSLKKDDLILELVKQADAKTYLSGTGALKYMDTDRYEQEGIKIEVQEFSHPHYPQLNSPDEFKPGISCLDMLFNIGIKEASAVLQETSKNEV
ncbi:hypothetical protein GCM10027443_24880 [Pontibacter brevis]